MCSRMYMDLVVENVILSCQDHLKLRHSRLTLILAQWIQVLNKLKA